MEIAREDQLLFLCSRSQLSGPQLAAVARLRQTELDWEYVLEASIQHGVAPLLYWGISQLNASTATTNGAVPGVPASTWGELKALYEHNKARNRRLYAVLAEIATAFQAAGVSAMGLKDAQLALEVYPDLGLRPIGDIDLMIRPEDFDAASRCLRQLEFTPLPDADIPYTLKYTWGTDFRRTRDNVWVDLQWNVVQREFDVWGEGNFDLDVERLWRGARAMSVNGCQLLAPNPEDMFLHLCLHLEGHRYAELVLFSDLVEMLRHYDGQLRWDYIVEVTKRIGAESSVYYVLLWLHRLFDVTLPVDVLAALRPAYFQANVFGPLYKNLPRLHLALDDIRLAVSPPADVMRSFEAETRRQTLGAIHIFRQIDQLAGSFAESGGEIFLVQGAASEKTIPDASLRPFEDMSAFVLADDLPRMREALAQRQFLAEAADEDGPFRKRSIMATADPLLSDDSPQLDFQVTIERDFTALIRQSGPPKSSKRMSALKALKARLGKRPGGHEKITMRLQVFPLTAEELIFCQSARLGRPSQQRLFDLCSLAECFRHISAALGWDQIIDLSRQHDVERQVREGLVLFREFEQQHFTPACDRWLQQAGSPHVLEWARHDPDSTGRYSAFKRMFFYALTLASTRGIKGKAAYFLRSLVPTRRQPLLPRLMLEAAAGVVAGFAKPKRTSRSFAYWTEPEKQHASGEVA